MLNSINGDYRIPNRYLFNHYLARVESNGSYHEVDELVVVTTMEIPNIWGELPAESKRYGMPVVIIDGYSSHNAAVKAMNELDAIQV